jgi:hypothetical protein
MLTDLGRSLSPKYNLLLLSPPMSGRPRKTSEQQPKTQSIVGVTGRSCARRFPRPLKVTRRDKLRIDLIVSLGTVVVPSRGCCHCQY